MNVTTNGFEKIALRPYPRTGLFLFFILFFLSLQAQNTIRNDTVSDAVYRSYMAAVGAGSNLYNGTEYTAYYASTRGTPFWDSAGFQNGIISYGGVVYRDVPLAYDIVSNEVLIRGPRQLVIKLDMAKIDYFQVAGHLFIKFTGDAGSKNLIPEDIYDLRYNDNIKVYVKRKKQVSRNIGEDGRFAFMNFNSFFVYKDNTYHQVSKKNDLLNIFRDKSDALRSFWKEQRLNFRSDPERMIVETAAWYARLKNEP